MGKGSRGKGFFKTRRKIREKRIKRGEKGPAYTPPLEERSEPELKYGKGKVEIEGGILTREEGGEKEEGDFLKYLRSRKENGLGLGLDLLPEDYITPENIKPKRGRMPEVVKEEDAPSYLWRVCLKASKKGLDASYCSKQENPEGGCPMRYFCFQKKGPGDMTIPINQIKDVFKVTYPFNYIAGS